MKDELKYNEETGLWQCSYDDECFLMSSKHYDTIEHSWTRQKGWVFKDDKGNIIDTERITLVKEE